MTNGEEQSNKRKAAVDADDTLYPAKLCRQANSGSQDDSLRLKAGLRIVTDTDSLDGLRFAHETANEQRQLSPSQIDSDVDSLFDNTSPVGTDASGRATLATTSCPDTQQSPTTSASDSEHRGSFLSACRAAPPIPGLYFDPTLRLPDELADEIMWTCIRTYFQSGTADQVMLFECSSSLPSPSSAFPPVLTSLLSTLSMLLRPLLPPEKHALLFPTPPTPFARQAILNLYWPGEGITPHVDLLDRYGDGIIGVSLGSGCVMQFAKVRRGRGDEPASQRALGSDGDDEDGLEVYLPPGSLIVFTEEARFAWTHGIAKRLEDLVESEDSQDDPTWISRGVRLSVTFRWLLPGADVVGGPCSTGSP